MKYALRLVWNGNRSGSLRLGCHETSTLPPRGDVLRHPRGRGRTRLYKDEGSTLAAGILIIDAGSVYCRRALKLHAAAVHPVNGTDLEARALSPAMARVV